MSRVFDFHVRLVDQPGAVARLLSTLDGDGIARAAVSAGGVVDLDTLSAQIVDGTHVEADAGNDAVLDACAGSGGRLVPFHFGNPYADPTGYALVADRFRGLELSPAVHGVAFDDPRTLALVEIAAAHRHPVYVVCLGRPGCGAADLVTLAGKFPDVTFVFGHCGFIGVDVRGVNTIAEAPNIVAETSGCFAVVVRTALNRLGPDRVVFGSEYPLQRPAVELAKFASLELDASTWQKVAWDNAHRLLDEENTP